MNNHNAKSELAKATVASSGCSTANQDAIDSIETALSTCTIFTGFAGKTLAALALKNAPTITRGITNYFANSFAQLYGACGVIKNSPCSTAPITQAEFDAALAVGGYLLVPELGVYDIANILITAACDLGSIALDTYKKQESCCTSQCTSSFCQNYQSVCLQTPYTGGC